MANIKKHLDNIKGALYGKDVRSSIHDGIDAINKEVESTTGRQVDLENIFDQLVINAGNSNAEIVDARVKNDGTSYSKLGDRLDAVDSQLEHIANIDAKQLGFRKNDPTFDNSIILKLLMETDLRCELFFNEGDYYFSEICITNNNIRIRGVNSCFGQKGTVFKPFNKNQRYIIKLGGDKDFNAPANYFDANKILNYSIVNIIFTDYNNPVTHSLFAMEYCSEVKLDLTFYRASTRCVYLKKSWEIEFENLYIRHSSSSKSLFFIDETINDGISNVSRVQIKNFDTEDCIGTVFEIHDLANATNMHIDKYSFESTSTNKHTLIENAESFLSSTKIPLFKFGYVDGLTIGNMNLHGLNKWSYLKDGNEYVQSIFEYTDFFNVLVGNININDSGAFQCLSHGIGSKYGVCHVNSVFSSYRNRLLNLGTTNKTDLVLFESVENGLVDIQSTNMCLNNVQYALRLNERIEDKDLMLVANKNKNIMDIILDSTTHKRVLTRTLTNALNTVASFNTDINIENYDLYIKLKTNAIYADIQLYKGTTLSRTIKCDINTNVDYCTIVAPISSIECDNIKIIVPMEAETLKIEYIEALPSNFIKNVNKIQFGTFIVPNANTATQIFFTEPFSTTPVVTATIENWQSVYGCNICAIDRSSFRITTEVDNAKIHYIAIN